MLHRLSQITECEETRTWYVLYTKPFYERKLVERLLSQCWTVYCSLKELVKQWCACLKVVEEILFPIFILIQCRNQDTNQVFQNASALRYHVWLCPPAKLRCKRSINSVLDGWIKLHGKYYRMYSSWVECTLVSLSNCESKRKNHQT